jgi:hypothetical protein
MEYFHDQCGSVQRMVYDYDSLQDLLLVENLVDLIKYMEVTE